MPKACQATGRHLASTFRKSEYHTRSSADAEQHEKWKGAILRKESVKFHFGAKECEKPFHVSDIIRADASHASADAASVQREISKLGAHDIGWVFEVEGRALSRPPTQLLLHDNVVSLGTINILPLNFVHFFSLRGSYV